MPFAQELDQLVEIFSSHSVSDIENSDILQNKIDSDFYKCDNFIEQYSMISEIKLRLETIKQNKKKSKEQISECLQWIDKELFDKHTSDNVKLIHKSIFTERPDIIIQMIKKYFYQFWEKNLIEKYEQILDILLNWKDYFFSYTNGNAREINNDYKLLLNHVGLFDEDTEDNCVTKLIVTYLKSYNNLIGFFDRDNMKCGDDIQEKIFEYCQKSFTFIQLVQHGSFRSTGNWCYKEYQSI